MFYSSSSVLRPNESFTTTRNVGAPVVLSVVAEEVRRSTMEPPAQATVVEVGLLLGEPGNSPPFFENDKFVIPGVPHLSGVTQVSVLRGPVAGARNVMFVVAGENPDPAKTAETLAAITGGRIVVQEIRPYTSKDVPTGSGKNVPSPFDAGRPVFPATFLAQSHPRPGLPK